jgi:predicted alpha/beta hydrolase family esterase
MDALQFGPDLKPIDTSLVLGGVIKSKASINQFSLFDYTEALINEFKDQNYTENEDLFLFPYDWRYGVSDQTIDQLQQKISEIKDRTDSETVDVIAHSTGGLLVKKYVIDNPTDHSIGKAIFVGVPNIGAPKAIKALIQGDSFGVIPLSEKEMKKIAENLPVVYDLSPSEQYFNQKGSYIKIIDQKFFTSKSRFLNFAQSNSFINFNALTNAHKLHTADFDNYDLRTAGVDLYSINGCKAGTMGNIVEVRSVDLLGNVHVSYNTPTKVPGDGTVPLESSTNLPIDEVHKYYALKSDHAQMMSAEGIRQQIVNLLTGTSLDTKNILTQDITKCKLKGRAISIYSPLSIDITDQDGNHSGMSSNGDDIENNIPNADYQIMDEHKFVYLPDDEGQTYTISVKGTGVGTFTLTDATIDDNQVIQTQVFKNIPVTTALVGNFNLGDVTLTIDTDGDGSMDKTLHPSLALNESESEDYNPQETEEPQEEEKTTTGTHSGGHGGIITATQTDPLPGHPEFISGSIESQLAQEFTSLPAQGGDSAESGRVLSIETRPRNSSEVTDGNQSILSANASSTNFPATKKVIVISIVGLGILYFIARKFVK